MILRTLKEKRKEEAKKVKRLAQQRLLKSRRYSKIKSDPELLEIERKKRRMRYLKNKETKKVTSITEKTSRAQKEQRKKWRENSKKYRERKKGTVKKGINLDTALIEVKPVKIKSQSRKDMNNISSPEDPLALHNTNLIQAAVRQVRYKEKLNRLRLFKIIEALKKKTEAQRKQIYRLKQKLTKCMSTVTKFETKIKNHKSVKSNEDFNLEYLKQTKLFENIQDFYNEDGNSTMLLLVRNNL